MTKKTENSICNLTRKGQTPQTKCNNFVEEAGVYCGEVMETGEYDEDRELGVKVYCKEHRSKDKTPDTFSGGVAFDKIQTLSEEIK